MLIDDSGNSWIVPDCHLAICVLFAILDLHLTTIAGFIGHDSISYTLWLVVTDDVWFVFVGVAKLQAFGATWLVTWVYKISQVLRCTLNIYFVIIVFKSLIDIHIIMNLCNNLVPRSPVEPVM